MVFEINLLPEKYRKKKIAIRVDGRIFGVIGGLALVGLLAFVTINQGKKLKDTQERHAALTAQKAIVEQTANRVRQQKEEIRNITNRINTLQALGGRNAIQLQLLEIVSSGVPDDVYLLDINQNADRQAQQRGGLTYTPEQVLNFRGVALRKEGVTQWLSRLQEEELIQQVQTNYLRPTQVEGVNIYEFSLTAVMNVAG
jgi:Tfp pilus assembly protein PilN